jgi:transcriptional regulator with XRE-family HTH domain
MMPLGEKIAMARIEAGLTQEKLSELVGKKPATVSRWEHGHISPKPKTLAKIAEVTGKAVSWFTRGDSLEGELLVRLERLEKKLEAFTHVDFDPVDVAYRLQNLPHDKRKLLLALIYQDPTLAAGVKLDRSLLSLLGQLAKSPAKEEI